MAPIAIVSLMAAGTAVSAYGAYSQGQQQAQAARAQSAWQAYNARITEREAEAQRVASAFEARQHKRQSEQLMARQRSLVGSSGVTMAGSPLLLAEDTAQQLAMERANIRMQGNRKVSGLKSRALLEMSQAAYTKSTASQYAQAGMVSAGASLLSGAGQVGYAGYQMGLWGTTGTPKLKASSSWNKHDITI